MVWIGLYFGSRTNISLLDIGCLTITNLDGDRDDLEDGDDLEDRYDIEDGPILCCHFHCHVTVVYLHN